MRITTKGQVTIPREIREKFGMEPGTEVEFVTTGSGDVLVKPKTDPRSRMQAWIRKIRGTATTGLTTDEIMAMTRGED